MKRMFAVACVVASITTHAVGQSSDTAPPSQGEKFGQPETIELILEIGKKWQALGNAPFGVGDIALRANAVFPGHLAAGDHRTGLGVDIRPVRRDGSPMGVRWQDPEYDQGATQRLVDLLIESGQVERIVFSDPGLKGTAAYRGLDDHLHVTVRPRAK